MNSTRWLAMPLFLVVFLGFTAPILYTLSLSVTDPSVGSINYETLLTEGAYLQILGRSLRIAFATAAICCCLGYVFCYWVHQQSRMVVLCCLAVVSLSFWASVLVRTYAWIVILGNGGIINQYLIASGVRSRPVLFLYNEFGVVVGMVNVLLPIFILPMLAAMMKIDQRLMAVARTLGASEITIFRKVFFPLTLPAVTNTGFLIIVIALGFYITPAILGGGRVPMVANLIDLLINKISKWGLAAALSTLLLVLTLLMLFGARSLSALISGVGRHAR